MYHSISDGIHPLSVSISNFDKQMKFMKNNSYKSINFEELDTLEPKNKYFIITFDDGYKDNVINALPILNKYSFKSTCFIVSDFIGNTNKWDAEQKNYFNKELLTKNDINEWLRHGMSIGSHGKSHKSLINLHPSEIQSEILNSKEAIENNIGSKINSFSYPFGHVNKISADNVKNIYNFAVTTIRSRFNTTKHKVNYIPRIHMSNNLSKFKLFFKLKTFYEDIKYNEKQLYL